MRVEHEGTYAIVASVGGAPKHPTWYGNVKVNPHVELRDGTVKGEYMAREVTGEEKAIWWERAVEAYPSYADYQKKTDAPDPGARARADRVRGFGSLRPARLSAGRPRT